MSIYENYRLNSNLCTIMKKQDKRSDLFMTWVNAVWKFCFAAKQWIRIYSKFSERNIAVHRRLLHNHK